MGKRASINAVALRVTLFFARNPDEHLTSNDITEKFDIPLSEVHSSLKRIVDSGMISRDAHGPGRGKQAIYSAGHELLVMIGERRVLIEACMPAPVLGVPHCGP